MQGNGSGGNGRWGRRRWEAGILCLLASSACERACQREPAADPASSAAAAASPSAQSSSAEHRAAENTAAHPAAAQNAAAQNTAPGAPGALRLAYSDWPGWVAWQVAIEQRYFDELGVQVAFEWLEYVPTIEAFSEGKVDAVCMTNGDALVAGSSGAPSVGILLNDYSSGNDMLVARQGIDGVAMLRNKKIAVEVGFVDHLLLMRALESVGLREADVDIVNTKTHEAPELLRAGRVDAIAAWQPHSGRALDEAVGAKALFTSANVPGLIYDLLFVSPASLSERRADWVKVVAAWFRAVDFILAPQHRVEAIQIMARRMGLPEERYAKLMAGTHLLGREENQRRFRPAPGFESVQGSSEIVDRFNVANRVYRDPLVVAPYFDGSLVDEALRR